METRPTIVPLPQGTLPHTLVYGRATRVDRRDEKLDEIRKYVTQLARFQYSMSYNTSYFGEPQGLVKRAVAALTRLVDDLPPQRVGDEDPAETAYWEFDARRKGDGQWKGAPQSERDAFKAVVRGLLAQR